MDEEQLKLRIQQEMMTFNSKNQQQINTIILNYNPYDRALTMLMNIPPLNDDIITGGDLVENGPLYIYVEKTNLNIEENQLNIGTLIRRTNPDNTEWLFRNIGEFHEEIPVPPRKYHICLLDTYITALKTNPKLIAYIALADVKPLILLKEYVRDYFNIHPITNPSRLTTDFVREDIDDEEEEIGGGRTGNKNSSKKTKHYRNRKHTKKNKMKKNTTKRAKRTKKNKPKRNKTKRTKNAI